jgi:hypothetical protein
MTGSLWLLASLFYILMILAIVRVVRGGGE